MDTIGVRRLLAREGRPRSSRQVVLNLLSNAMKFTSPGGRIAVNCVPGEHDAVIRVADTGIGIPENNLELIFEPFVQLDSALTRTANGTGLGLAIAAPSPVKWAATSPQPAAPRGKARSSASVSHGCSPQAMDRC